MGANVGHAADLQLQPCELFQQRQRAPIDSLFLEPREQATIERRNQVLLPDSELESGFEVLEHAVENSADAAVESVFDALARRMKAHASG